MARLVVHNGTPGQVFDETHWDKVLDVEFTDLTIEVQDEDGNTTSSITLHDPKS